MDQLGFKSFAVAGHDRGGRVAHRMALDHPERVERAALLDIIPTLTSFERADMAFAMAYYHWFFLAQPFDLPERMIGADPKSFLRHCLSSWARRDGCFDEEAQAEYERCYDDPAAVHATCCDYRAGATIDLEHDRADSERRIECPLLCLWGEEGFVGRGYDVLAIWRQKANTVEGRALPGGHFVPEEAPEQTLAAFMEFFK
jgi:haloacetate dehalogenase